MTSIMMAIPTGNVNSPYLSYSVNSVYRVYDDGNVSDYDVTMGRDSCGIFISMIYYECDIDILYITITFYFLEVLKYET